LFKSKLVRELLSYTFAFASSARGISLRDFLAHLVALQARFSGNAFFVLGKLAEDTDEARDLNDPPQC
jgi:hypothetical protein